MEHVDSLEVSRLIAAGEGPDVEFKSAMVRPEHLAKECVGLANSGGGVILIGVRDDGTICGTDLAADDLPEIVAEVQFKTDPPVPVQFTACRIAGRQIVVLDVRHDLRPPHRLLTRSGPVCYVRSGDGNVRASPVAERAMREVPPGPVSGTVLPLRIREALEVRGRITATEFATLANVSLRRARRELVELVQTGVLTSFRDGPHEYFSRR